MPNVYEGPGARLVARTSRVELNIIEIGLSERSRDAIETTHLGSSAKTFKAASLIDYGEITVSYQNNPDLPVMVGKVAETWDILWPLETGETTPAQWTFSGFVTKQADGSFKVGDLVTGEITIRITGSITKTPAR